MNPNTESKMGKFIVFEGIDGSGKTTQLQTIAEWLPESGLLPEGVKVVTTREPGCLPFVRSFLKNPETDIAQRAELMLFMADRAQLVHTVIRPALESGDWVLCDRFYTSTLAYQGWGRGVGWQTVKNAHDIATLGFYPDFEIFIDIPADESARRLAARRGVLDSFESQGRAFTDRVLAGYEAAAKLPFLKEYPHVTIDGCCKVEEVTAKCKQEIKNFLSIAKCFLPG